LFARLALGGDEKQPCGVRMIGSVRSAVRSRSGMDAGLSSVKFCDIRERIADFPNPLKAFNYL
jgi:hypothetical protein